MPPQSSCDNRTAASECQDLVDQDGQLTVADMVRRFSISAVTIRNDFDALASIGAVVRSHGGAVRRLEATQDYPLRTKSQNRKGRHRIGRDG